MVRSVEACTGWVGTFLRLVRDGEDEKVLANPNFYLTFAVQKRGVHLSYSTNGAVAQW